jgi:cell wall-associated NlpC family hydrolase
MHFVPTKIVGVLCLAGLLIAAPVAQADEDTQATLLQPSAVSEAPGFIQRTQASVQDALDQAMDLLNIPYRRGGSAPETGFDCSGFVKHVFREGLGLILPRSSRELSNTGETVQKDELKPGDLVFFNTMRRAFSHVGIYLGNNQFVHAPRTGASVRVEDIRESYWKKRYNGARRVSED